MADTSGTTERNDGTGLIGTDAWLQPFADALRKRHAHYRAARKTIDDHGGLLGDISKGHHYFGLNRGEHEGDAGVWYREWAPAAKYLSLIGDFNDWDRGAHALTKDQWGVWSVFIPDRADGSSAIAHEDKLKVHVYTDRGATDRIPAYITRVVQDEGTVDFQGQYWNPAQPYAWQNDTPPLPRAPRIYEAHVGMAQEEGKVGTYAEFTANVLPRIAKLGYNAVQLMAVKEHPYYGSFGYHVSNFFAPSSRFGTPEELKALIDTAHGMGLRIIMDIVHGHAVKNVHEGLNQFDGSDHQYFHAPPRGVHSAWDSLLFDYTRYEVKRFLLSNLRYWLEEYRFDGFRFDGVTSMLYLDHGLGRQFAGYDEYFDANADLDSQTYLRLANELVHAVRDDAVTIAEDVSGMPGIARPIDQGGLGFDYRLAMGVPDYWVKLVEEKRDEQWSVGEMYGAMLNRRRDEPHIGYTESHDQAMVGGKTLAYWLMDQHMFFNMSVFQQNMQIDRGIALHKMIRLLTFALSGEGYLNFMGNEFGHPEWIDFPREGNNFSYHHARRQWSLVDRDDLRYKGLNLFDRAMHDLDMQFNLLSDPLIELLMMHEDDKLLVFRRGPLVCAMNFHADRSASDLRIPVPDRTDYRVVVDSDAKQFEGHDRLGGADHYPWQDVKCYERQQSLQIYLPARSAQVLAPKDHA